MWSLIKKWRIKRLFGKYISSDAAEQLFGSYSEYKSTEMKDIYYLLIFVKDDNPDEAQNLISAVIDITLKHHGTIDSNYE